MQTIIWKGHKKNEKLEEKTTYFLVAEAINFLKHRGVHQDRIHENGYT